MTVRAATEGVLSSLGSLAWMLICVIGVLALAYLFTRYAVGRGKLGGIAPGKKTEAIRVMARTGVGREAQLLLVEVGERHFLLGVTGSQISCLAEFTPEEAEAFKEGPGEPPPSFLEALKKNLKEVKHR